jgi:hypothetical protein
MLDEPSTLENFVEDILVDLMDEKIMSIEIQVSSTGGLQESPLTGCRSIQSTTKKRRKHSDDLANAKQIPSVLPDYILPLAGVVNCDSIPRDFEYTMITTYILKGIRVVGPLLGHIPSLKNNKFNLRYRKNYVMLMTHRHLMKTTGKKSCIVSQLWIKEIAQSTILNMMKIPHFG